MFRCISGFAGTFWFIHLKKQQQVILILSVEICVSELEHLQPTNCPFPAPEGGFLFLESWSREAADVRRSNWDGVCDTVCVLWSLQTATQRHTEPLAALHFYYIYSSDVFTTSIASSADRNQLFFIINDRNDLLSLYFSDALAAGRTK